MDVDLDNAESLRNALVDARIAVRTRILDEFTRALDMAMQRGFWGQVIATVPFQDGVAGRSGVDVKQHTAVL